MHGTKFLGGLGQNDPRDVEIETNICWEGGQFLAPNCVFWAWSYLKPFGLWRCAIEKGRKEGKQEDKLQECIFHVCVEQPQWAYLNQTWRVCLSYKKIKRSKFHLYNSSGCSAVGCQHMFVYIGKPGRPEHSALRYRARIWLELLGS